MFAQVAGRGLWPKAVRTHGHAGADDDDDDDDDDDADAN